MGLGIEGWIAPAALGFLAVLLTPTVIGVFIVFVVAHFIGVPLLWAYLGALLFLVIAAGLGAVGFFLTRAIVRKFAGSLEQKSEVRWGPLPASPEADTG